MSAMSVMLVLSLIGLVFIFFGLSFHLDYSRRVMVYWTTYSGGVYGMVPIGVGFLISSLAFPFPHPNQIGSWLMGISFGFLMLGIILVLTMPMFLTPWWFRYLRENYDGNYILHILMKDAAKNYPEWKERTKTKEGLANWAEEVSKRTQFVND